MSNNTCDIRGYLAIKQLHLESSSSFQSPLCIEGWINTDQTALGGQHPFIAMGKAAEIMLAQTRENHVNLTANPVDSPNQGVGVAARGKLMSLADRSFLDIRNIHFFNTSNPIGRDCFGVNTITLAGVLTIPNRNLHNIQIGHQEIKFLEGILATDQAASGGHHPILLVGTEAIHTLTRLTTGMPREEPLMATIGGRLLTIESRSYVQVTFLSLGEARKHVYPCDQPGEKKHTPTYSYSE